MIPNFMFDPARDYGTFQAVLKHIRNEVPQRSGPSRGVWLPDEFQIYFSEATKLKELITKSPAKHLHADLHFPET